MSSAVQENLGASVSPHGGAHPTVGLYLVIAAALFVLLGVTVGVAYIDLGALNIVVAMTIAVIKGTLVVLYFMHVRYNSRLVWLFAGAGFFWLLILFFFT